MPSRPTVVVGAGPAGRAAAAVLRRAGTEPTVLERDPPGASWRRHYRSLRLHTVRSLSSLPGADIPRSCGRWVAGADFLAYLERYAERERLDIRTLGLPAQVAAIPLSRAPRRPADAIAGLERRVFIGDLAATGLEARGEGVFTRHARRGVLPILDHGFARAVRAGGIGIVPAVEAIEGEEVVLHGGRRLRPDAVVADAGIDFARMRFREPITGALRELRFESAAIASAIV